MIGQSNIAKFMFTSIIFLNSRCLFRPFDCTVKYIYIYIFQSPPKGPTIPYKAAPYTIPPPSSVSPIHPEHAPANPPTAYASPPPCPPVHMEAMPLMPPLFQQQHSPAPLMSPHQYSMGPCVRYTAVPLSPSVLPLMAGPEPPKPVYCQAPIEASKILTF